MMFRAVFGMAVLMALAGTAAADKDWQMIADVRGEITIGADGAVKNVALDNVQDPKFRQYLTDRIASWEFHPVAVNGKGVEATVPISFNLIATSDSSRKLKQLEFAHIEFGQSAIEKEANDRSGLKPSRQPYLNYPRDALIAGAEGILEVALNITEDGTVRDAAIYRLSMINAAMPEARVYARDFSDEALSTIKKYRWAPHELAMYGCAGGCIATIGVEFKMADGPAWKNYRHMQVKPVPWLIASEMKDMNQSEQSQIVRLKEDQTGKPVEIGG